MTKRVPTTLVIETPYGRTFRDGALADEASALPLTKRGLHDHRFKAVKAFNTKMAPIVAEETERLKNAWLEGR